MITGYQQVDAAIRTRAVWLDLFEITHESLVAGKQRNALQWFSGDTPTPLTSTMIKAGRLAPSEAIDNDAETRDLLTVIE